MNTRKIIFGTVVAIFISWIFLVGAVLAEEDSQGTVLTDDIRPYDGPIGADSPLYGLKIALEGIDESFTANETARVGKQMNHAQLRLSEVRRALDLNQSDSAGQALDNYLLKMNLVNFTISRWSSNATGLLHAEEMIVKHQLVLENLLASHPNNTGLQRAYANSLALEEKFAEKTAIKYQRTVERNNQTILRAIRLEQKEQNSKDLPDVTTTTTQKEEKQKGADREKGNDTGNGKPEPTVTTQGQGHQTGKSQDSNNGNNGKDNSRNK